MITIQMTRTRKSGKAVFGAMVLPFSKCPYNGRNDKDVTISTLENADFIIPAGTYPLERTFSPKFKKELPIIENVPDREGIRIHRGSKPEHSQGCILTDMYGMSSLDILFNRLEEFYDDEDLQIEISDDLHFFPCPGSGSGQ